MKRGSGENVAGVPTCAVGYRSTPYIDNGNDVPLINRKSMDIFFVVVEICPENVNCFPLLAAGNYMEFTPTYCMSCEMDPLRDDAFVMETALRQAVVPTRRLLRGFAPFFWGFPQLPESGNFVANLIRGVEWVKSHI